jgi:hypothetical protein
MAGPWEDYAKEEGPWSEYAAAQPSIFEQRPAAKLFDYGPASEALGGLMDIGAMIGAGGTVATKQIAEKPMQPLVDVARGAVALPIMAGQAAMGDIAAQQQLRGLPLNIMESYGAAYGSPKAAFMTAATEPGRFATDIMSIPALGGAAVTAGRAVGEGALGATRAGLNRILPIARDEAAIQNRLAALTGPAAPADIRTAYEQGVQMPRTPGMPAPTLAEAAAAGGVELPGLAALEKSYAGVETPEARALAARPAQQAAAIRDQLVRVDAAIQDRARALSPEEMANPRIIRDVPLRNLAEERKALESKLGALQKQLPATDLFERGVGVQKAAITGKEAARKELAALYEKPFVGTKGAATEDITPFIKEAQSILADTTAGFAPRTAPESLAARISSLAPEKGPAIASFRDLGSISKAINSELKSTYRAGPNDPTANIRRYHLTSLKNSLDNIIDNSPNISPEAREEWRAANQAHVEKMVKPYRTGVTADLLRTNIKNETVLPPDKTVERFLSDGRNARQFVTTFGNNPAVMTDVNNAILSMARKAAVKDGIIDPEALSAFAEKYREPLQVIGSNVDSVLSRVQTDAAKMQKGIADLTDQATALKKTDWRALVDSAVKSSQEMSFLKERLRKSPEALEALAKEVSDRVLTNVNAGEPKAALKMLDSQRRAIIGAVGKEQYDALRELATDQLRLKEVEKIAPKTDAQLRADISGFTDAQKTDLKVAIDDIQRMKQMERLAAKAPSNLGERVAEEAAFQWYNPLSYPYNLIHATQRFLKKRQESRVSALMAKLIAEDPERMLRILETGRFKPLPPKTVPAKPRVPAALGSVSIFNAMADSQNRNAMAGR